MLPSDLLDGPAREEVRKRAATWVETRIRLGLSELMDARATAELPAGARGIVFQLCEGLGVLPRRPIEQQLAELSEEDRKALARLGVRVGVYSLYFPSMLKPVPIRLRAGLWMVANNRETIPPLPAEGRTSMDLPHGAEREFYATIGYLPLGDHAIRADMVERLAAMARHAVRESREAARRAQQQAEAARSRDRPQPRCAGAAAAAVGRRDQRMGDRGRGLRRERAGAGREPAEAAPEACRRATASPKSGCRRAGRARRVSRPGRGSRRPKRPPPKSRRRGDEGRRGARRGQGRRDDGRKRRQPPEPKPKARRRRARGRCRPAGSAPRRR